MVEADRVVPGLLGFWRGRCERFAETRAVEPGLTGAFDVFRDSIRVLVLLLGPRVPLLLPVVVRWLSRTAPPSPFTLKPPDPPPRPLELLPRRLGVFLPVLALFDRRAELVDDGLHDLDAFLEHEDDIVDGLGCGAVLLLFACCRASCEYSVLGIHVWLYED